MSVSLDIASIFKQCNQSNRIFSVDYVDHGIGSNNLIVMI